MAMEFDLLQKEEKVKTENGALGYKTTGSKLLDLSYKVPEMRNSANNGINLYHEYFRDVFRESPGDALRFLFYLRDIRGGLGERNIFRNILINMAKEQDLVKSILENINIAEYGRWDDFIEIGLSNEDFYEITASVLLKQLKQDTEDMRDGKSVSLLAKWMPSESTSSKKTRRKAKLLAKLMHMDLSVYRRIITSLRKYIGITESQMSKNEWFDIDYSKVPSKANLVYKKAFFRHDPIRRKDFLEKVAEGKAKIHADTLYPYEIVHKYEYINGIDSTLENLWNALPAPEIKKNVLVVRDGSYSMTCRIANNDITAMQVGDSITLYMAQNNIGSYKDKFITFSSRPQIVDLSNTENLQEKLYRLSKFDDCSNTDIESVFKLVLKTVLKNEVPQEEIPDILIISDMEFDRAMYAHADDDTLMENIAKEWKSHGYELPKLMFWNVNSRTNAIPIKENSNGLILVSGFSARIANMVLSNELDPLQALLKILHKDRYNAVVEKIIGKFRK